MTTTGEQPTIPQDHAQHPQASDDDSSSAPSVAPEDVITMIATTQDRSTVTG